MTDTPPVEQMKPQLSAADVAALTQARRYGDIERARLDGQLDDLMAGKPVPTSGLSPKPAQLSREDLADLRKRGKNAEIDQARIDGRLDDLLNPNPDPAA